MKIDIQALNFDLSDSILGCIKDRLNFTLSSRFDQIKSISIKVDDINGPRGGLDKRCQVRIAMPRLKDVIIEDIQADLYVAIFRATDRASRTVKRRLNRLQDKKRKLFVPNKTENNELMMNGQYVYQ